jgi:1-phosphofructokinase
MAMIVIVGLNPSLDRTLTVARLDPQIVNRAHTVRMDPGGKGLNVARALSSWGLPVVLLAMLGGGTGTTVARLLAKEQVPNQAVPIDGETRSNIVFVDEATGTHIKVNEPGPIVTLEELDSLEDRVLSMVDQGDLWIFAGQLPPGAPHDTYARLIHLVQSKGARALLDASGRSLVLGTAARPFLVKPNHIEAQDLVDHPVESTADAVAAIRNLWQRGIKAVIITRGGEGAIFGWQNTIVEAVPPAIDVVSSVGSGDATMAALAWGIMEGLRPLEMARLAVAAGTATAMVEGTGMASLEQVEAMRSRVQVQAL